MAYTPSKFPPASVLTCDGTCADQSFSGSGTFVAFTSVSASRNDPGFTISGGILTCHKTGSYFVVLEVDDPSGGGTAGQYILANITQAGSASVSYSSADHSGVTVYAANAAYGDFALVAGDTLTFLALNSVTGNTVTISGIFRVRFIPTQANPQ